MSRIRQAVDERACTRVAPLVLFSGVNPQVFNFDNVVTARGQKADGCKALKYEQERDDCGDDQRSWREEATLVSSTRVNEFRQRERLTSPTPGLRYPVADWFFYPRIDVE